MNRTQAYPFLILLLVGFLGLPKSYACTIVSAVAANGQVWNCNNEDGALG
jgi:hypothetical protein